jgi:hypothetical protein
MSSVSTVAMSSSWRQAVPSTWTTSSSTNARTTWQIASVSRITARNWFPSPSPVLAPFTMPAMSRNVTVAWIATGAL